MIFELIEVSDCCGTRIIMTDICSKCKEHCEPSSQEVAVYEVEDCEELVYGRR